MHILRTFTVTATVLFTLACAGMTPEEKAKWEKEQAEKAAAAEQQLTATAATLAAIDQKLATTTELGEVSCDAARIQALVHKDKNELDYQKPSTIRRDLLPAFAKGPFTGTKDVPAHLSWMNSEWLVKLQSPLEGRADWQVSSDKEWIAERLSDRAQVLLVYIPTEEAPAKVAKQDGVFTEGVYDMGFFDGFLTLWDFTNGEFLCSTYFSAESSSSVQFDDRGLMKTTFEEAVEADFKEQVQNKATEARQRLTPDLRLGYQIFEL